MHKLLREPMISSRDFTISESANASLLKQVLDSFIPHHLSSAKCLYVGPSAGSKDSSPIFSDDATLNDLGLSAQKLASLVDVVLYVEDLSTPWLCLLACSSGVGHITAERKQALDELSTSVPIKTVYVSAFEDKRSYINSCDTLAWNTSIWLADNPTKLISHD